MQFLCFWRNSLAICILCEKQKTPKVGNLSVIICSSNSFLLCPVCLLVPPLEFSPPYDCFCPRHLWNFSFSSLLFHLLCVFRFPFKCTECPVPSGLGLEISTGQPGSSKFPFCSTGGVPHGMTVPGCLAQGLKCGVMSSHGAFCVPVTVFLTLLSGYKLNKAGTLVCTLNRGSIIVFWIEWMIESTAVSKPIGIVW